ncbi:MAG: FecR domain-containing protein [Leptospira sp.]|nr:FecR domain-containing protein [Leptospira sp.]
MKNISRGDLLFILFLILSTLVFAGMLYSDMTKRNQSGQGEVIGTITFKERVAQRKFQGTIVWETLEQNAPLHNRDSIRTANLSEAEITLNDGTKIDLDENSMVLLNLMGSDAELDFSYGRISTGQASGTSNLKIRSGNEVIQASDSKLSLTKTESSDSSIGSTLSMLVEKGMAKIERNGEFTEVKENEKADLNRDKISVTEKLIRPIQPENMLRMQTSKSTLPVTFSWKSKNKQNKLILSRYASMKEPWKILNSNLESETIDLPPGNHYWKVVSGKDETEVRSLTLYQISSPSPITPGNNTKINSTDESIPVTFTWKKAKIGTTYMIQVNRKGDSKILWEDTTRVTTQTKSFPPGRYEWKVGLKSPINQEVSWSNSQSFSLEKISNLQIPATIQPITGSKVLANVTSQKGLLFSWRYVTGADSYKIIITESNSNEVIHSEILKSNHLLLKKNWKPGKYTWKIQSLNKNYQSDFSPENIFIISESETISTLSPEQGSVVFSSAQNPISFRWKKIPSFGKYRVQLADEKGNKKSKDSNSNSLNWGLLEPGTFQWTVEFLNSDGTVIAQSLPSEFTIKKGITPPVPIQPKDKERVDLTYANQIRFEWKPSPFVRFYRLEIYPKGKMESPIYKEQTTSNIYFLKRLNRLTTGFFTWKVVALSKEGLESNSETSDFEIFLNPDKGKLEFTSPETFYVE